MDTEGQRMTCGGENETFMALKSLGGGCFSGWGGTLLCLNPGTVSPCPACDWTCVN